MSEPGSGREAEIRHRLAAGLSAKELIAAGFRKSTVYKVARAQRQPPALTAVDRALHLLREAETALLLAQIELTRPRPGGGS